MGCQEKEAISPDSMFSSNAKGNPANVNASLFNRVNKALGGKSAINQVSAISYESSGVAFEFQEDPEPVNGKVADFSYDLLMLTDGSKSRQAWSIQTDYAYESDFSFVEKIDGFQGKSDGPTGFFSVFFAGFGVEGDPMFSTKLAARKKTMIMSSPIAIAQMLTAANFVQSEVDGTIMTTFNTSPLGFGASTPDIAWVIDLETALPVKAQIMENDPLFGDVLYEVVYGNWTSVNGVNLPTTLEHILDGNTIRTETLSNYEINPTFNNDDLTVSTPDWPFDPAQARHGHLSSQFHFRTLMQTFAIDFPVEFTDATSPLALPSETVGNDADVFRVSGDFQSPLYLCF